MSTPPVVDRSAPPRPPPVPSISILAECLLTFCDCDSHEAAKWAVQLARNGWDINNVQREFMRSWPSFELTNVRTELTESSLVTSGLKDPFDRLRILLLTRPEIGRILRLPIYISSSEDNGTETLMVLRGARAKYRDARVVDGTRLTRVLPSFAMDMLDESQSFLFILTAEYLKDPFCILELVIASKLKIPIICLLAPPAISSTQVSEILDAWRFDTTSSEAGTVLKGLRKEDVYRALSQLTLWMSPRRQEFSRVFELSAMESPLGPLVWRKPSLAATVEATSHGLSGSLFASSLYINSDHHYLSSSGNPIVKDKPTTIVREEPMDMIASDDSGKKLPVATADPNKAPKVMDENLQADKTLMSFGGGSKRTFAKIGVRSVPTPLELSQNSQGESDLLAPVSAAVQGVAKPSSRLPLPAIQTVLANAETRSEAKISKSDVSKVQSNDAETKSEVNRSKSDILKMNSSGTDVKFDPTPKAKPDQPKGKPVGLEVKSEFSNRKIKSGSAEVKPDSTAAMVKSGRVETKSESNVTKSEVPKVKVKSDDPKGASLKDSVKTERLKGTSISKEDSSEASIAKTKSTIVRSTFEESHSTPGAPASLQKAASSSSLDNAKSMGVLSTKHFGSSSITSKPTDSIIDHGSASISAKSDSKVVRSPTAKSESKPSTVAMSAGKMDTTARIPSAASKSDRAASVVSQTTAESTAPNNKPKTDSKPSGSTSIPNLLSPSGISKGINGTSMTLVRTSSSSSAPTPEKTNPSVGLIANNLSPRALAKATSAPSAPSTTMNAGFKPTGIFGTSSVITGKVSSSGALSTGSYELNTKKNLNVSGSHANRSPEAVPSSKSSLGLRESSATIEVETKPNIKSTGVALQEAISSKSKPPLIETEEKPEAVIATNTFVSSSLAQTGALLAQGGNTSMVRSNSDRTIPPMLVVAKRSPLPGARRMDKDDTDDSSSDDVDLAKLKASAKDTVVKAPAKDSAVKAPAKDSAVKDILGDDDDDILAPVLSIRKSQPKPDYITVRDKMERSEAETKRQKLDKETHPDSIVPSSSDGNVQYTPPASMQALNQSLLESSSVSRSTRPPPPSGPPPGVSQPGGPLPSPRGPTPSE